MDYPKNFTERFRARFDFARQNFFHHLPAVIISIVLILIIAGAVIISPPKNFVPETLFTIEEGESFAQISNNLKSEGYIRSVWVLRAIVSGLLAESENIVAGDYIFDKKLSIFSIARRITSGDFHLDPIRITIPEGLNKFEVADLLADRLTGFDKETFVKIAPEGWLFPDTYFFTPVATPEKVVTVMTNNFEKQITPLQEELTAFGRTNSEILTMASIVETEARQFETRRTIAGILWKRLELGMPLQVDVSFKYINGKTTQDLSLKDLEEDSPYNTYKYAGLPPTPIANPGLDSILATITPIDSDYLYFLSDRKGTMHYAATFDEHKANKVRYLR